MHATLRGDAFEKKRPHNHTHTILFGFVNGGAFFYCFVFSSLPSSDHLSTHMISLSSDTQPAESFTLFYFFSLTASDHWLRGCVLFIYSMAHTWWHLKLCCAFLFIIRRSNSLGLKHESPRNNHLSVNLIRKALRNLLAAHSVESSTNSVAWNLDDSWTATAAAIEEIHNWLLSRELPSESMNQRRGMFRALISFINQPSVTGRVRKRVPPTRTHHLLVLPLPGIANFPYHFILAVIFRQLIADYMISVAHAHTHRQPSRGMLSAAAVVQYSTYTGEDSADYTQ